jgi:hypothetical protein
VHSVRPDDVASLERARVLSAQTTRCALRLPSFQLMQGPCSVPDCGHRLDHFRQWQSHGVQLSQQSRQDRLGLRIACPAVVPQVVQEVEFSGLLVGQPEPSEVLRLACHRWRLRPNSPERHPTLGACARPNLRSFDQAMCGRSGRSAHPPGLGQYGDWMRLWRALPGCHDGGYAPVWDCRMPVAN